MFQVSAMGIPSFRVNCGCEGLPQQLRGHAAAPSTRPSAEPDETLKLNDEELILRLWPDATVHGRQGA
jgi:hypothetical protein